jgi:hypothetical protein
LDATVNPFGTTGNTSSSLSPVPYPERISKLMDILGFGVSAAGNEEPWTAILVG